MAIEQIIFIVTAICGGILSIVNIAVQRAKRTVNRWAREVIKTGKINSREASELGTIYSNPFSDWFLEIDEDYRFQVLRNSRIREKIKEYRRNKKIRNILMLIFGSLVGLLFYTFVNSSA